MVAWQKISQSAHAIRKYSELVPAIAIVTGTGLRDLENTLSDPTIIDYKDIPYFSGTSAPSHAGHLFLGKLAGKSIALLSGRLHYYEGLSISDVVFPIYVLGSLAIHTIIITNVAGSVNPNLGKGEIVALSDHINLMFENPLRGAYNEKIGPRFPDMTEAYDSEWRALAKAQADTLGIRLTEGVYAAMAGPSLETKAEYAFARDMGADLVGMSTVPEVIVARQLGIRVLAFSIVSNVCSPPHKIQKTTVEDVIATAQSANPLLKELICRIVSNM